MLKNLPGLGQLPKDKGFKMQVMHFNILGSHRV